MSSAALRAEIPALPTESESQLAKESSRLLAACIGQGTTARLKVFDGNQEINVPMSALKLLVDILAQMAEGNAVTIIPTHAVLTTQQAADFLNVSRPHLVGLIDRGAIRCHKVGSHRRIAFADLKAYKEKSLREREQAMADLAAQAQAEGMGY